MIVKVVLGLSGSAGFVLFWKRGLWSYPRVQKEVDEIFGDPPLGDEVHHGKEQERLVRCSMVGYLRGSVGSCRSGGERKVGGVSHATTGAARAITLKPSFSLLMPGKMYHNITNATPSNDNADPPWSPNYKFKILSFFLAICVTASQNPPLRKTPSDRPVLMMLWTSPKTHSMSCLLLKF